MSDRSRERFTRKRRKMDGPLGMNFGLVAGVGIGMAAAFKFGANPLVGVGIGVAVGVVFGGLAGRFLKPARRYQRVGTSTAYAYDGMPFEDQSEEGDEASEGEAPRSN